MRRDAVDRANLAFRVNVPKDPAVFARISTNPPIEAAGEHHAGDRSDGSRLRGAAARDVAAAGVTATGKGLTDAGAGAAATAGVATVCVANDGKTGAATGDGTGTDG